MYTTKKDVDAHVRNAFSKITSERERQLRGLTIAKMYYRVNEFNLAEQYALSYLKANADNEQVHKLLGQCYLRLQKPENALQFFQRSLNINPKQPEVIIEVCKLLLEEKLFNAKKALYWCSLAETEKVVDESVFNLRLKLMRSDAIESTRFEEILTKQIQSQPHDVVLRIRLLQYYIDQNKIMDGYKYVQNYELKNHFEFINGSDWYSTVWLVLSKYEALPNAKKDWDFWFLLLLSLDRQIQLSFNLPTSTNSGGKDTANLLFTFDQYLFKLSQSLNKLNVKKELAEFLLNHYRGQMLLHSVALIYNREIAQNKNRWKETSIVVLPLLLLAYQVENPAKKEPWMMHCDQQSKLLLQFWSREAAFRCIQVGRSLLSCINDSSEVENKLNHGNFYGSRPYLWNASDELINQIRSSCSDKNWRHTIFSLLFCNTDQKMKEQTSFLVKCPKLAEPLYELPDLMDLQNYEDLCQLYKPQSLAHMVYLCLGSDNLARMRARYFSGLPFSVSNLAFSGVDSLNQLDMDSFMYATAIQAKRALAVDRENLENYYLTDEEVTAKPSLLLFHNVETQLCSEEQSNWWLSAFNTYKNIPSNNPVETRQNLQYGIEAVRGLNGPKADIIIVFKLGKVFVDRTQDIVKANEKLQLEARAANIFKYGLNLLKMQNKGILEPFRKYFKYAKANCSAIEKEVASVAEEAISFLAARYFKEGNFEEFIDELNGVQLPFASYLQAEAYRKLDEISKTPRTQKRLYIERASECLSKTLELLKNPSIDPNHPLNSIIQTELNKIHQANHLNTSDFFSPLNDNTLHNNSSTYEDAEEGGFGENSMLRTPNITLNRSRRDSHLTTALQNHMTKSIELENLVKQMAATLNIVKDELLDRIKPEISTMNKEISGLKDKVTELEEAMKKSRISSSSPSREDVSNALDLYAIDEALQSQMYTPSNSMFPNLSSSAGMGLIGSPFGNQVTAQPQRILTPNAMQMNAPFNSALFNPSYPMNYNASFMMGNTPGQAAPALNQAGLIQQSMGPMPGIMPQANPLLSGTPRNAMNMPFAPPGGGNLNFNLPPDNRSSNFFGLLNPPLTTQFPMTMTMGKETNSFAPTATTTSVSTSLGLSSVTTTVASSSTITSTPIQFNKALNNQPVEKGPPANVVITASDPLPNPSILTQQQTQQPPLSVTIPSHHIKPSLVPQTNDVLPSATTTTSTSGFPSFNFNAQASFPSTLGGLSSANPVLASHLQTSTPTLQKPGYFAISPAKDTPPNESSKDALNNDKTLNKSDPKSVDLNQSSKSVEEEYDPRPDFQPIIPLPDEVEVRTGEEDEEVVFTHLAKLYRLDDKEWKERGRGDIKILKNKEGLSRVVMRREQTHKICANHKIVKELSITPPKKDDEKSFIWVAQDFADEEVKNEKFLIRFKSPDTAKQFYEAFKKAQKEHEEWLAKNPGKEMKPPSAPALTKATTKPDSKKEEKPSVTFTLAKSSTSNFITSTPTVKAETVKPSGGVSSSSSNQTPAASLFSSSTSTTTTTTTTSNAASKSLFSNLSAKPLAATEPAKTSASASPFAQFSFGTPTTAASGANTPFGNIFSNIGKSPATSNTQTSSPFASANLPNIFSSPQPSTISSLATSTTPKPASAEASTNKSTNEEPEDDYEPTAVFNPVIPLPELVEVSTGEENELVLFEHRAKLLRFDKEAGEWKERGLGNIKLLQDKNDVNKVRLVMRREQIHKLCCNQRLYKDTHFKYAKNSETALTWAGQDYSENELITEMLTIRFKTPEICKKFHEAILKAQANMTDTSSAETTKNRKDSSTAKDKKETKTSSSTAAADSTTKPQGFGDKFKPKAGSWSCEACYISNNADVLYCVACDSPKDSTVPKKDAPNILETSSKSTFSFGFPAAAAPEVKDTPFASTNNAFTFGNATKTATSSPAIFGQAPKSVTATTTPAAAPASIFGQAFKPSVTTSTGTSSTPASIFGQAAKPATVTTTTTSNTSATAASKDTPVKGFGDAFKPKAGSWDCQSCYLSNIGADLYCKACEAPKDDSVPKKDSEKTTDILALSNPNQTFSFGFANANANTANPPTSNTGFSFGLPAAAKSEPLSTKPNLFDQLAEASTASKSFSFTPPQATSTTLDSAGVTNNTSSIQKEKFTFTLHSKAMEPKPLSGFSGAGGDVATSNSPFSFSLQPQSISKPAEQDNADDDEYHEEEENNTYFTPVIPLPDKVEVKTGEECEELLFCHRAKLYRYVDHEWKERGIGKIKILRHKDTGKLRVVMRRDQVLKICLNHALDENVEYKAKDDKSWLFAVNDFSEGQIELQQFAVRFKNKEIAEDFMKAVKASLNGTAQVIVEDINSTESTISSSRSESSMKSAVIETTKSEESAVQSSTSEKKPEVETKKAETGSKKSDTSLKKSDSSSKKSESSSKKSSESSSKKSESSSKKSETSSKKSDGAASKTSETSSSKTETTSSSQKSEANSLKKSDSNAKKVEASVKKTSASKTETNIATSTTTKTGKSGSKAFPLKSEKTEKDSSKTNIKTEKSEKSKKGEKSDKDLIKKTTTPSTSTTSKADFVELQLPEDFCKVTPCSGCIGCHPDKFAYGKPKTHKVFTKPELKSLPMEFPVLKVTRPKKNVFLKQSSLAASVSSSSKSNAFNTFSFSTAGASLGNTTLNDSSSLNNTNVTSNKTPSTTFSFATGLSASSLDKSAKEGDSLFGTASGGNSFGGSGASLFGGTSNANNFVFGGGANKNIFGGSSFFSPISSTEKEGGGGKSIFGTLEKTETPENAEQVKSIFGGAKPTFPATPASNTTSIFGTPTSATAATDGDKDKTQVKSIFGGTGFAKETTPNTSGSSIFGGKSFFETEAPVFGSGAPLFGSPNNLIGSQKDSKENSETAASTTQTSIFGTNTQTTSNPLTGSIFGGNSLNTATSPFFGSGSFSTPPSFADLAKTQGLSDKTIFGSPSSLATPPPAVTTTTANSANNNSSPSVTSVTSSNSTPNASIFNSTNLPTFADLSNKNEAAVDFASLASKASNETIILSGKQNANVTNFIGLTHQEDAFTVKKTSSPANAASNNNDSVKSNDGGASNENNDDNYDPHYDPIIELPNEIVVSTGEEEEVKVYGERAVLYRFDSTNSEWKERGVGELKILFHPNRKTYRMVMRREQIHKLVLNHAIGADFSFDNMKNNQKSFLWAALNFAESPEGEVEKLAVRFKKQDLADAFRKTLNECLSEIQKNSDQ